MVALTLVPPAPSSTRIRSPSERSAPISFAPSRSMDSAGTVPSDRPAPEPEKEVAVAIPETTTPSALVSKAAALTSPVRSPVTLPVRAPMNPPVEVVTPEALTLRVRTSPLTTASLVTDMLFAVTAPEVVTVVRLMSLSRATETPLEAAVVVTLEPPEIVRSSVASAISSEPLSPSTVRVVTTFAVLVAVTRPLASTVMTGI